MSRADDLASVFAGLKAQGPGFGFRQGTVVTWNVISGAGTVSVGGTVLTDVPFLNSGNLTWLVAGDTVLLLREGSSWFILGRVNSPGGLSGVGRNTQQSITWANSANNFGLSTTLTTVVGAIFPVPEWAEAATVTATLHALAWNSTAAVDLIQSSIVFPDGGAATWSSPSVPTLSWGGVTLQANRTLVPSGPTISVFGQMASTGGAWAVNPATQAYLSLLISFNSDNGS